jgi:4-hydroxy-3-methylbut-2-enyl diphosphate reductase
VNLDFGAVHYLVPSHFGFCLGVKNAIERAYETLWKTRGGACSCFRADPQPVRERGPDPPGTAVPSDRQGRPTPVDGRVAPGAAAPLLWDTLTPDDIVIIPAFGATDEDKGASFGWGVAVRQYDATCMLVEKVWKAARAYGREGYTVVIHGKHEHEETKATFSNTRRYAPAVIVRNIEETRQLGEIIATQGTLARARFYEAFAGKHTPGFDVERDLGASRSSTRRRSS